MSWLCRCWRTRHPRRSRRLALLLLAVPALFAGCQSPAPVIRSNSDLLDELANPPTISRGELGPDTRGGRFDHAAYAALLRQAVRRDGAVDYTQVKRLEPELNLYLVELGDVPLDTLSRYEQLALLLNAYNAFTLKMIAENPGIRSPTEVPARRGWTHPTWVVDRQAVSLELLEHQWIRSRFRDPRIHFALVHGAVGSPPLLGEPYTGDKLIRQLEGQARRTLADPRFAAWVDTPPTLRLGAVFARFKGDFAEDETGLVRALVPWLPDPVIAGLKKHAAFRIEYLPFDWRLNGTW